jgi:inner membrane protein
MIVRDPDRRGDWNGWGLKIATIYLALTAINKGIVEYEFRGGLRDQGIPYEQVMTTPSFFNNVMWHGLAANDDTVWSGVISHLDGDLPLVLQRVPKRRELLNEFDTTVAVRKLLWFSQGFYRVTRREGELHFDDLHVGRRDAYAGEADADASVFSFRLIERPDEGRLGWETRRATDPEDFGMAFDQFLARLFGEPYAWEIRESGN